MKFGERIVLLVFVLALMAVAISSGVGFAIGLLSGWRMAS